VFAHCLQADIENEGKNIFSGSGDEGNIQVTSISPADNDGGANDGGAENGGKPFTSHVVHRVAQQIGCIAHWTEIQI
jgi:hypothetical protein